MTHFLSAYITASLWSSIDDNGDPLDDRFGPADLAPELLAQMTADCAKFESENAADIALGCTRGSGEFTATEQAGHDFWLTRNGHGAGFWDGDWRDGDDRRRETRLTIAAKAFGPCDLYVGDDGRIYG